MTRDTLLALALLATGACASHPPVAPAPVAVRFSALSASRPGWHLPDTIPDTTARHIVAGDATGDGIPDLAFLVTRGDSATIYFLPGMGRGMYGAPVEVATTDQLDNDVLFILPDHTLGFGKRDSDDFFSWRWDRKHRRMKLIPEPKDH